MPAPSVNPTSVAAVGPGGAPPTAPFAFSVTRALDTGVVPSDATTCAVTGATPRRLTVTSTVSLASSTTAVARPPLKASASDTAVIV